MPKPTQRPSASPQRNPQIAIVIMAAGKGTRLKSKHPKVLHAVGGQPVLAHVVAAATQVVPAKDVFVIVGHEADRVRKAVEHTGVQFVLQTEQRGTGHALIVAQKAVEPYDHVLVLSGDAPLIRPLTISALRDFHLQRKGAMTLLTAELANPTGYGRVLRKSPKSAEIRAIVEEKAASPAQKKIREINAGFYAFNARDLYGHIGQLSTNNTHGEYLLTDMAAVLGRAKRPVLATRTVNPNEILGGNTRAELVEIDQQLRMAKCQQLMTEGVTIFYPATCVIDTAVEVGLDTVIEPFVQLIGATRVGSDCRIRSYSVLTNSEIGDGVLINPGTIMDDSRVASAATIGPYSRLRPGSDIGEGAHLGNFVETKKMKLGKGSKANHLTYLGDAEIGEGVNVGAGTITCNYDGVHKHKTVIGDRVFVGSDTTLVAPIKVGAGAYIGAASCLTEDVPDDSLAIGRARQTVKEGWAKAKRDSMASGKK
jgi:bifunctional UDP-N-acetylglucosamine pyrophosphorylase / glucosamine-1-phosphate N-acetyltransferase